MYNAHVLYGSLIRANMYFRIGAGCGFLPMVNIMASMFVTMG